MDQEERAEKRKGGPGRGNTAKKLAINTIEVALSDISAKQNLLNRGHMTLLLNIVESQVIKQNTTREFISFCPESPDLESQVGQLSSENKIRLAVALGQGEAQSFIESVNQFPVSTLEDLIKTDPDVYFENSNKVVRGFVQVNLLTALFVRFFLGKSTWLN